VSDNLDDLVDKLLKEEESNAAALTSSSGSFGEGKKSSAAPPPSSANIDPNLKMILDIPLRVTVELGRTKMSVKDLVNLGQGAVIELNKLAGEPLEVFVNDKLIARGEAVVVNEKFGVRLTDIISTKERVEQLK
jgi:flagellar motor switch protein FliN